MATKTFLQPFLKWAGGKRQLLPQIREHRPQTFTTYFEPFVGGGAVLLDTQPGRAVINDVNSEIANVYRVIRDSAEELIVHLQRHANDKAYFYEIRSLDRTPSFKTLSEVERASRLLYLNKTCYNGLFRVNSQGQFNVPFGAYKNPNIVNAGTLRAVQDYLSKNNVDILSVDFAAAVAAAGPGDFVYFDPPYDPVSKTASFTNYSYSGFGKEEQLRLKRTVDDLSDRGCKVMLSNSATDFIKDLYRDYTVVTVSANRAINANAAKRGKVEEVLVLNYG